MIKIYFNKSGRMAIQRFALPSEAKAYIMNSTDKVVMVTLSGKAIKLADLLWS